MMVMSVISAFCMNFTGYEAIQAEVYTFNYIEEYDMMVTTFELEDGSKYYMDDYCAPRFSKCILIMDTHNNDDVYDDEIVHIINFY